LRLHSDIAVPAFYQSTGLVAIGHEADGIHPGDLTPERPLEIGAEVSLLTLPAAGLRRSASGDDLVCVCDKGVGTQGVYWRRSPVHSATARTGCRWWTP
jgi:hypothetical protein